MAFACGGFLFWRKIFGLSLYSPFFSGFLFYDKFNPNKKT